MRFRFDVREDRAAAPFSRESHMDELRDIDSFRDHALALEARIAAAEAVGDEVPEEARAMLASLRDLARAVEGLRTTITEPGEAPRSDAPAPDKEER